MLARELKNNFKNIFSERFENFLKKWFLQVFKKMIFARFLKIIFAKIFFEIARFLKNIFAKKIIFEKIFFWKNNLFFENFFKFLRPFHYASVFENNFNSRSENIFVAFEKNIFQKIIFKNKILCAKKIFLKNIYFSLKSSLNKKFDRVFSGDAIGGWCFWKSCRFRKFLWFQKIIFAREKIIFEKIFSQK